MSAPARGAAPHVPTVPELDALPDDAFVAAVAPLFEGGHRFLRRLASLRPLGDVATLFARAEALALELPEDEAIELVDAHPRLGAPPGTVSALSYGEQGYDRAPASVPADGTDVAAELARLNAAYEARFGFRYCVFVAGRPHAALVPGMGAALTEDRDAELHRALDAVVDIAAARRGALRSTDG